MTLANKNCKISRPLLVLVFMLFIPLKIFGGSSLCSGHLSNGLMYYIHHDPYSTKQTSLDFIIKSGSLDEQEGERGFSHLIEHLVINSMEFKDKKISNPRCEFWDFSAPNADALASYDYTQYHFEISLGIPSGLEAGLLGFSTAISNFSFDEEEFEELKDEILDEMDQNQISPIESWKHWRIGQEYPLYRNRHPLGNEDDLISATPESVQEFYQRKYQPHQIGIIITGNVDLLKTKDLIEKHFGHLSNHNLENIPRPSLEQISDSSTIYIHKRLKNSELSLSTPLPRLSQRDNLILSILTQLLSEHLAKTTPKVLFFNPIIEILTSPPLLRLSVSLRDREGIDQLRESLESFFNQSMTTDQVDLIKSRIKNHLKILQENGNDPFLIDFYRDHFVFTNTSLEQDHPNLRSILIDSVHADDINRMLQTIRFSHVCMSSFDQEALEAKDLLSGVLNSIQPRNSDGY